MKITPALSLYSDGRVDGKQHWIIMVNLTKMATVTFYLQHTLKYSHLQDHFPCDMCKINYMLVVFILTRHSLPFPDERMIIYWISLIRHFQLVTYSSNKLNHTSEAIDNTIEIMTNVRLNCNVTCPSISMKVSIFNLPRIKGHSYGDILVAGNAGKNPCNFSKKDSVQLIL